MSLKMTPINLHIPALLTLMNPTPEVTYECHACGKTFSSELGLRAHDSVCIPRNMPAAASLKQNPSMTQWAHRIPATWQSDWWSSTPPNLAVW